MKFFKLSVFLFAIFMIAACGKDDVTAPVITITSPADGSILEKGKTYPVEGTITDDTELAEIVIGDIKVNTFDSPTKHTIANIQLPIPADAEAGSSYFVVTAKDKAGNTATKNINFTVK
ncbi:MAG: hypothetical protein J5I52_05640 [Saprospiraceae bacterium]|nr:MAG: hypothetical protein UZ09_BCD002000085 [Bacteroidetes bacterium OLB9]MCO6463613.1 hypothetical protein [Saprospiraceae bacterium]MCZ2339062.1 DUF4625 domain-containing protein [Chitinophagales bacterium]